MKNKSLKVLMIDSLIGNDYSIFLCNELQKIGIDITLIMTEDRRINLETKFKILRIMPSKDSKKSKLKKLIMFPVYLLKIIKLISTENFNIIHYQFFRSKTWESIYFIILKFLPVKIVHTAHDVVLVNESKINILYNKLIYNLSDILIVHSNKNKIQLATYYKINEKKIYITPHGSFDFYKEICGADIRTEKNKLGIDSSQFVLLFFGFIKEYKGLNLLLEALLEITDLKLTLIIAGEFESESLKEKTISQIEYLPKNITVVRKFGFVEQEEISPIFSITDLVILPYKTISHSGVLHVAYSFSKPVLVTNVGDFEEIVENNKSGFVVEPNKSDMANKIIEIVNSKYDLDSIGKYAKSLNDKKYSWEASALELSNAYKNTI